MLMSVPLTSANVTAGVVGRFRAWWVLAGLAVVVGLPALSMSLPHGGPMFHALFNLAAVAWTAHEHFRHRKHASGREGLLRALGLAAMVPWLGFWVGRGIQLALGGSVASTPPALGAPALLALVICVVALLSGPDAPATLAGKLRMALDGLIIALSFAGLAWLLVLRPAVRTVDGEISGSVLLALSGMLITVVSIGLLLAFGSEMLRWTMVEGVALGVALLAAATFATLVLRLHGVSYAFTLVGGLTAVGGLVIGYAARLPLPAGHAKLWNPLSTSAQVLPFVPVTLLLGVTAVRYYRGDRADPPLVWLGALLVVAVMARQVLALQLNSRLAGELNRQRSHLAHQAFHDPLTGLANRALFGERLAAALGEARPRPALLLVDLDGFKKINDTRGHAAGDELLVAVAVRLRGCVRATDTVARLGGDEFAVLRPGAAAAGDAVGVAQVVLERLGQPVEIGSGPSVRVQASVGIALADAETTAVVLQRDADLALYEAKQSGRNRYRVADHELSASTLGRLRLEEDLRRGVEAGQFQIHYQPIVELASEKVVGVEALLRWRHPERGLLLPAAFVECAETSGVLPRLDRWVLRQACRQVARWRKVDPEFGVSVNISAAHLGESGLVDQVSMALAEAGVPPSALMLEVTETALVADLTQAAGSLRELAELGIRIALDDFGTGYSSLTYLRTLPIHTLKIDRSFVRDLAGNATDEAVTKAILGLAETLGLRPVAEGVECGVQAARLREMRCGHAQGFLYGRPMPAAGVTELLQTTAAQAV
jgi:diguanylate cyclase (GGDEF)-like protein